MLNPSAELYRAIFESAAQGIVVVDAAGTVLMTNAAMEGLFGFSPGEMKGMSLEELVPKRQRAVHAVHRTGYFAQPHQRPMGGTQHLDAVRRDGTIFPVEVSLGYSPTPDGMMAIGFVADISERRRLERTHQRDGERMRALTAQLLTAQEDERRRIARELHDGLTQDLASVGIEIGLLRRQAEGALQGELTSLQRNVSDLSEQVRRLAHEFHPGVLEHSGLGAALEAHCREMERQLGMAIRFTARDLPDHMPREVAATLYRITQEALRNVVKHASATRADVLLTASEGDNGLIVVRLSILDDGKGFLIEDVRDGAGLGLLSIEERARLVHGTLTIGSVPGEGTRVTVEVPLYGSAA